MLVVTRIALLPLAHLMAQLRLARLRRHAAAAAAVLRRRLVGLRAAVLPALPALPAVGRESVVRVLRAAAACVGRGAMRGVRMLLLWLRVAVWVVLFSILWGASLALVVLATTWIALDVLSVPGQDLDSVLARLKQARHAPLPAPYYPSLPPATPPPPCPIRASAPPRLGTSALRHFGRAAQSPPPQTDNAPISGLARTLTRWITPWSCS